MNSVDLMRLATRLFYIFPVKKNRIVLTAYNGRQYGCSPKYITESLLQKKDKYEINYAVTDRFDKQLPEGVKRVKYKSLKHFYLLMTARFIVFNSTGFSCMLPYRKSQMIINTWHGGGAFKKTGISAYNKPENIKKREISGNNTTYFISSSKVFGDNQRYSMCLSEEKILNIGTPRNDILFGDNEKLVKKVHDHFGVDQSYGFVLYAPTYRDGQKKAVNDFSFEPIDVQLVLEAARKRFGKKFIFLYRAHHNMIPDNLGENCLNATGYDDMQELLAASDILITDYSSSMWDFALTGKPGFLYAPDKKEYPKIHELASPVESWAYPAAETNSELASMIEHFDPKQNRARIDDYYARMGSFEKGDATDRLIQIMEGANQ